MGDYSVNNKTDVDAFARMYIDRGYVKIKKQGLDYIEYIENFWTKDSSYIVQKKIRGSGVSMS
ncbi:MAG: hypothetical protein PQJ46_02875 [Spirochaetales bacterium]|nr:hypothetical protein [Spirochaetales bacterium]